MMSNDRSRGFTLFEIVVTLAILILLLSISITTFSAITKQQGLDKDVETAYSYLLQARNKTINGEDGMNYGVRFSTSSIEMFAGTSYQMGSTSVVTYYFLNRSYLYDVALSPAGSEVYFKKITGTPSATGTVIYRSTDDSTVEKRMTIHGSGLVEVQ